MSAAMPIAFNRKRKDMEEEDAEPIFERRSGIKGVRRSLNLPQGMQEEAQFHPLPEELSLQLLANLGYNVNTTTQHKIAFEQKSVGSRASHHSSSSTASDTFPSTPIDNMAGSAESYFTKGINQPETCAPASYPHFEIYPGYIYPRPPGLLGMLMTQSKSAQSFDSSSDGMDVDVEQAEEEDTPFHG
jgi:hypothetical protein